ncbi:vancomycin resistance protein YoaR [Sporomusaceae bacterium BoRhaA]|nr:vancomycin resistance protein YoaR [Pelorhabdus rhamnosifermentans]
MTVQLSFQQRRITYIALFSGIIFLFTSVSFIAANATFLVHDQIYQGVTIDNIAVGGLAREAAQRKIETVLQERITQYPIVLTEEDKSYLVRPDDIQLQFDSAELVRQAYGVGRSGNVFTQLKDWLTVFSVGRTIPLNLHYNHDQLEKFIKKLVPQIDREARNATLVIRDGKPFVKNELFGKNTAIDKTIAAFDNELSHHASFNLPIIVEQIQPAVVAADLNNIDSLLISYTTHISDKSINRNDNILLAASHLDGKLIKPGQIFSFNDSIGSLQEKFGYKEAPVLIDGKVVSDVGGGVCQVSSTLYNAALLADMTILERNSHSSPPDYVPLGRDATVADNILDLRFQNTSVNPVYIVSEVVGNKLTIYIYGKDNPDAPDIHIVTTDEKVLEPTTVIKDDDSLTVGNETIEASGQQGYEVTTYRIKSKNGQEISREFLATDKFLPSEQIIKRGTKAPEDGEIG